MTTEKLLPFDDKNHEELFYLFIAEFIDWPACEYVVYPFTLEGTLANRLLALFPYEYADEEFITRILVDNEGYRKIKYSFVDE